jgi:hypothetical protein
MFHEKWMHTADQELTVKSSLSLQFSLPMTDIFKVPLHSVISCSEMCWIFLNCYMLTSPLSVMQATLTLSNHYNIICQSFEGTAPCILKLGTRCLWVAASVHLSHCNHCHTFKRRLGGPQSHSACYGEKKDLLLPPSAKVKKTWSCISTLPHAFKHAAQIKHFNFHLYRESLERQAFHVTLTHIHAQNSYLTS